MRHPLDERQIDALIDDVLAEVANPYPEAGFGQGLQQQSLQQRTFMTVASPPTNLLTFATLDRSAAQPTSRKAVAMAVLLNLAAALLVMATVGAVKANLVKPAEVIALVSPQELPPPVKLAPKAKLAGGGGGQKGAAPVSRGNPPAFAALQLNPPKAPPTVAPKIIVPVTVDVNPNLKMARTDMPNFGVSNSPLVGMSMGNGNGTGLGSGNGAGIGPGTGGNTGGAVRKIGGGVTAPVALYTPEPEFSEAARKAKVSGDVLVYLQVDEQGRPSHVRILRGLGMGLDEKAVAAVQQYRFKPAQEGGHAVRVEMNVDVNFQIF